MLETFLQTQSLGCQPLGHHTFNWKRTMAILRKTLQTNVKNFLTRGDELKFCMDSKPIANEISKNTGFKRDGPLNTFFKYSLAKRFNGSEKNEIYNLKV